MLTRVHVATQLAHELVHGPTACVRCGALATQASSVVMGLFAILLPLFHKTGRVSVLYVLMVVLSLAGGALDLGGNVMLVEVWGTDPWAVRH